MLNGGGGGEYSIGGGGGGGGNSPTATLKSEQKVCSCYLELIFYVQYIKLDVLFCDDYSEIPSYYNHLSGLPFKALANLTDQFKR